MQRNRTAKNVRIAGFVLAAVIPVLLCIRAWHEAEAIRGAGPGRGWFSVTDCADPRVHSDRHKNEYYTYTCTGTFDGPSATTGVQASLTAGKSYNAGDRLRAHLGRDGHVTLANGGRAAVMMAVWILVACGVAYVEVVGVRMLDRWIRGAPQIRLWPVSPGQVAQLFVIGAGIWVLALLPLVAAWHNV